MGTTFRKILKRFRFFRANREIFVFSVFLVIAVVFWFSQTFKDHTNVNIEYELQIHDVPRNLIFTSEVPEKVKVAVSGKGFSIMRYVFDHRKKVITVDYGDLPKMGGVLNIDNYVWKKAISKVLPTGVAFHSASPATIDIYYSMGTHKQVPVEFQGRVHTSKQHLLCDIEVQPMFVDVYAPSSIYDTLKVMYTEPVVFNDVKDTLNLKLPLQGIKGVKTIPDSVSVKICVDLFTSKTLKVPIYCENIPQNKMLRTFPLMAEVTFRVSATMFNNITAEDFVVVVDYNAINKNDSKCKLIIRESPKGIYNVRLNPEIVDYVIEQEED